MAAAIGLMLASAACRTFEPKPIEWQQEATAWQSAATNRLPLNLVQAQQLALLLNPEINHLRLQHQSAEKQALAAGWWEDPELDLDALRILRGGAHPWITGAGLSFTIPLNGVPGIEKRAARLYARADALAVTGAEITLLAEVGELWAACVEDQRCAMAQQEYKTRLDARQKQVQALIEAGELPKAEGDRIVQERIKLDLLCACCGPEAVKRRQRLLQLIGLHPDTPLDIRVDEPFEQVVSGRQPRSEIELVNHPRVLEKLARHAAGEEELRAEIRRQYPDLKIGPLLEHEEGRARGGLSLGLNLPLWNRNRGNIAVAEGERDAARLAAVQEWRALVGAWREASSMLAVAESRERSIREVLLPETQASAERTERLFEQGEADVLAVLAADEIIYNTTEALIQAQTALAEARIALATFKLIQKSGTLEETPDRPLLIAPAASGAQQ